MTKEQEEFWQSMIDAEDKKKREEIKNNSSPKYYFSQSFLDYWDKEIKPRIKSGEIKL